jgi:large subunit ribosomal protein L29
VTKQTDTLNELRRMTVVELDDHLSKQRRRLFEVRFQQATGQVENHRQVREIRHEIARAMTVKIEIERGLRPAVLEQAARVAAPKPKPARAPRARPAARPEVPAAVPAAEPTEPVEELAAPVDAEEDVDE